MLLFDPLARALINPVLWWVFVNGCDELFVDSVFVYLALTGHTRSLFTPEALNGIAERRLAAFVPLWREYAVIEEMVTHNVAAIDYGNYDIFLGVYSNDPRTQEKVIALEERYPFVHRAVCPSDGPTNKADCLNWIYQRMLLEEQERQVRYEVIVQHDAEDIVHPKAFRLINALAAEYDMIQVPVFPLRTPFRNFTHGTYCDEFAEWQVKDVVTRQFLGGFMPAAGVGTAYRREALEDMARRYRNQIFNIETLTEDYEIGLRFKLHDKRQVLAWQRVPGRNGRSNGKDNGNGAAKAAAVLAGRLRHALNHNTTFTHGGSARNQQGKDRNGSPRNGNGRPVEYVATREYFPRSFRGAVRQKSRWIMGVSLQAWEQWGWPGALHQLYWLWRDRKGLAGNIVTVVCNLLFLYCVARWLAARLFHADWTLTHVFPPGKAVWFLLAFNTFFLFERVGFRIFTVYRIYGARQAAGVVLRAPWANLINFCATTLAGFTYASARLLRRRPSWAKTAHAFPDRAQLMEFKRPLGEVLLELRLVSATDLEAVLAEQEAGGERLGEALLRHGLLTEGQLISALGRQQSLEVCELNAGEITPAVRRALPRELAERYQVLPVAFRNHGRLVVAAPEGLSEEAVGELRRATGLEIQAALAAPANWRATFDTLYPAPSPAEADEGHGAMRQLARPIAEILLGSGALPDSFRRAALGAAGLEFRRLTEADVAPAAAAAVPRALQVELAAVPLELRENEVVVAVARMLAEGDRRRLEEASGSRVRLVYTLPSDLRALLGG